MNIIYTMDCIKGMEKYIADEECSLVIADPPYNLGYSGTKCTKTKKPRFEPIANDSLTFSDYQRFTYAWLKQAYRILKPGHAFYFFIDWRLYPYLALWTQKVGFIIKNCIVWDKTRFGMGYHYRYQHEFIIYGIKPSKKPARRPVSRKIPDIWSIKKVPPVAMIHPTEKPVGLFDQILDDNSKPGELVVDLFVGSGPSFLSELSRDREMRGFEIDDRNVEILKTRFRDREIMFVSGN